MLNVNLTGGEPFARKDIVDIAKLYIKNSTVQSMYITTNASLPERVENFANVITDFEKDTELREELLKLDVKMYCATNGSKEHAINCMKKIGIDDLFEGKIMDIVDFQFKPKPNPESLKLMCDKFKIPTSEETVYIEDIAKNLSSDTAKDMTKVWFINDQPINDIEKYKDVIDYKIDNLALFLKKIRLLKEE